MEGELLQVEGEHMLEPCVVAEGTRLQQQISCCQPGLKANVRKGQNEFEV